MQSWSHNLEAERASRKADGLSTDDARAVAAANQAALRAARRHVLRRRLEQLARAGGPHFVRKS